MSKKTKSQESDGYPSVYPKIVKRYRCVANLAYDIALAMLSEDTEPKTFRVMKPDGHYVDLKITKGQEKSEVSYIAIDEIVGGENER